MAGFDGCEPNRLFRQHKSDGWRLMAAVISGDGAECAEGNMGNIPVVKYSPAVRARTSNT